MNRIVTTLLSTVILISYGCASTPDKPSYSQPPSGNYPSSNIPYVGPIDKVIEPNELNSTPPSPVAESNDPLSSPPTKVVASSPPPEEDVISDEILPQDPGSRLNYYIGKHASKRAIGLIHKHGSAIIEYQQKTKSTPLILASHEGLVGVVRLLLEYNADTQHADVFGDKAIDVASAKLRQLKLNGSTNDPRVEYLNTIIRMLEGANEVQEIK